MLAGGTYLYYDPSSDHPLTRVVGCDRPELFEETKAKCANESFQVLENGFFVARVSDYVLYNVEAENIARIVAMYGPATKLGAIVGGQTSCKLPEILALEKYVPKDVEIVSLHSMHGPKVDPTGQPLVVIPHRVLQSDTMQFVYAVVSEFRSKVVELSAKEHDKITADTQAVTHAAFLSMGKAWGKIDTYPWTVARWIGGIENAKTNIALRIYLNKWHVYAGLAITNKYAHEQILQYSKSTTELFTLMIAGNMEGLRSRLMAARDFVFKDVLADPKHEMLLDDDLLMQFLLLNMPPNLENLNLHLSLLAIVDLWFQLRMVPYQHMICSTPLFRIFLGVTEYLFIKEGLLDLAISCAVNDFRFRQDDLEFTLATRTWSSVVRHGDYKLYQKEFEETQRFFDGKFAEANRIGNEMIRTILQRVKERERA